MVCEQPAVDGRSIAATTNKKVPYTLQLEASLLRLLMLHSGSSPAADVQFSENIYVHLKFTVNGCKQTYTHFLQCSSASVGLTQARPN